MTPDASLGEYFLFYHCIFLHSFTYKWTFYVQRANATTTSTASIQPRRVVAHQVTVTFTVAFTSTITSDTNHLTVNNENRMVQGIHLHFCYDFEGLIPILNSRSLDCSEPRRVPTTDCWFILVV